MQKIKHYVILTLIVLFLVFTGFSAIYICEQDQKLKANQLALMVDSDSLEFRKRFRNVNPPDNFKEPYDRMADYYSEDQTNRRKFRILDPNRKRIFDGSRLDNLAHKIFKIAGSLLALILVLDFGKRRLYNG